MSEKSTFSTRIKELRSSLNMTQVQFASHVGTNQVTLSAYETGSTNPSLEVIKEIALKCNVSIDWLCGLSDTKQLNNRYSTYPDVLKVLASLCSTKYADGKRNLIAPVLVKDDQTLNENVHFITKNDDILTSFFKNWLKMYELLETNVISEQIYTQWLDGQLSEYQDHEINGTPF